MIRKVPLEKATRDFDNEFWRRLGASARLNAAWQMAVAIHGKTRKNQKRVVTVYRGRKENVRGIW